MSVLHSMVLKKSGFCKIFDVADDRFCPHDKLELWLSVLISKKQKTCFRLAVQNCLVEKGKENNKNDL